MRILTICCLVSALTACAVRLYPITSSYYQIPEGSRIELKRALVIPANSARVYMQYGKVATSKNIDQYHPHCWLLSRKVLEIPQTIEPDSFNVLRTQKYQDYVHAVSPITLASSTLGIGIGALMGDGPTAIEFTTALFLHSNTQPDIQQLECNHWEDPADGQHLTVEQMQTTLGEIAYIRINERDNNSSKI